MSRIRWLFERETEEVGALPEDPAPREADAPEL
jgi:hypothetical protein